MLKPRKSKVNLHDSSKSRKIDRALVDRISALPDSILGIILSFLSIENALATSILSRRWKSVWTTIQNLKFCQIGYSKERERDMKFVEFVNRVLLLHDTGLLNMFRLDWLQTCISSHACSWITTAITRNVRKLSLWLQGLGDQIDLPISVFSCESLQSLELQGSIVISSGIMICLPRLESLKLQRIDFRSEEALEKLISGCPRLKYLSLYLYHIADDFTCIISSTSLRYVDIFLGGGFSLMLKVSSLEYLKIYGGVSKIFVQKGLSSLIEAGCNINLGDDFLINSIVEAVRAFNSAKALTLSGDVMEALSYATISLSTEFKRLVKLEIETYSCCCFSLQDIIQRSDNLEVLTILQQSGKSNRDDHSMWTTPVEVPRCVSNSLKKFVLGGYYGFYCEREMIRYILKHGSALEAMKISCHSCMRDGEKLELLQEICKFPRKSIVCEVEFSGQ